MMIHIILSRHSSYAQIILLFLLVQIADAQTMRDTQKGALLSNTSTVFVASKSPIAGQPRKFETMPATGFLLVDKGKIYLVTSKKALCSRAVGERNLISDSLFFGSSELIRLSKVEFANAANSKVGKAGFVFSDDEENLAIISFQDKRFKHVLVPLLQKSKPIKMSYISSKDLVDKKDTLVRASFLRSRIAGDVLTWMRGVFTDRLINVNKQSFQVKGVFFAGCEGSPIFAKGKLAGIVVNRSNSDGSVPDIDKYADQATIIKPYVIVALLRKLQKLEN